VAVLDSIVVGINYNCCSSAVDEVFGTLLYCARIFVETKLYHQIGFTVWLERLCDFDVTESLVEPLE
jgi:hypothetical protein